MRKKMKQLMGILLSLVMVLGLVPGMSLTAYANGTTYNPASTYTGFDELITNDTEVTISEVSGKTWYVIANYSSTVTLLSKQSFGNKAFNSSGTGNDYATSEIKTYVDGLKGTGQPLAGISSVISDLTLIDITTAEGLSETKRKGAGADWWLCTRGSDASEATFVNGGSGTVRVHGYSVNQRLGVRPALKLNLSSVIFSSVNLSGGANATASGGSIIQNYFDVGTTRSSMTAVTYTANSGYKFPETSDYYTTTNGIKVERTSDTVVTVSGRPTANTNITIPDAHAHSFTYSASGATITATCTADGCDLPEVESKHVATLTIAANGGTYDGTTAYGATITDANSIQGDAKVQYQKKTDGSYGTATEIATTDAGEYKASITVGGATASVEYTITQADSTANAPTGLTATYGQTLADVPLEGKNPEGNTPGTWAWADSTKSVGNVVSPAATFKANFTPTSSNYKTVENVNVRVTVGKADPTAPTGLTATIGQTLANVTLPDGWTWADSTQSVGNVVDPAATFKANFTGNDNYNAASNVDVTVTVGKANAVAATVTANNRTYDGTEKPLVTVTGEATGGEMQYALGTATEATEQYTTSIPAKTEAGTYYVWYKIVGDKDHSDSTAKCVPAKIFEKLERTVTFKVVNGTWDDGTKSDQIVPLEGSEIDIPKLPSDKIPRAGSKPDDGYKEGAWDEVPVAGTEITKDRTYTYSYIEKDTITKTVTFKVVNGAWDDGATDDKPVTLTGKAGDVLKLTQDQIPAAGKKPNEGYKDGSWDVTPNTETAITENTTYTYTYASKESISRTVTFKVVNGSWYDGDAADKTVTLTGKEGDVLKLAQDQIPAAGKKPNEGYKKGYWDVTPNTETAITADTTYTYKYVSETQEEQTRVEPKSMEEYVISDELKNNTVYTSKEIIEASLRTELHVETEEQANNYSLFDAVLVVSFDDGKTWVEATADNFPEGGILAKFGFPTAADGTQTNGQEYTFKLAHLVETTVGTTKAGTIETPEVTVTEDGLSATLMGLSPVIISWEKKTPVPTEVEITLSAAEMSVTQGREKAITATTKPEGTAVTWSSSDKSVATVDGMGVVTGIKPGTATITAKITVEGAEYTANCKVTVIPASTPMPIPVPSGSKGGGEHTHNYVWKTIEATEDADGELRYQCETCGDIQTRVPLTAYNVFNKNTTEKIRKANKDATVKIETSKWISFHKMVMEALAERPDVTLEISFLDEGHKGNRCTVTIPKGTDAMSLVDKNGFTGFLFLGGKFGMKTQ